jgi:hypothetical protein
MIQNFIEPHQDRILSMSALGERWSCHPKVALQRAKQYKLRIIRFNQRAHGVKLSDILRLEAEASA